MRKSLSDKTNEGIIVLNTNYFRAEARGILSDIACVSLLLFLAALALRDLWWTSGIAFLGWILFLKKNGQQTEIAFEKVRLRLRDEFVITQGEVYGFYEEGSILLSLMLSVEVGLFFFPAFWLLWFVAFALVALRLTKAGSKFDQRVLGERMRRLRPSPVPSA